MNNASKAVVLSLAALLEQEQREGPIWSLNSEQFNMNVLRFRAGEGVAEHVNEGLDVVGVVIEGSGILLVDGEEFPLEQGQLFVIPRGSRRALRSTSESFAYFSCHRRRAGLMPS
jgi:quercetin dioxygenase-like cupin family protein